MPLSHVVCVLCVSYVFYQIGNSDDANALQLPKVCHNCENVPSFSKCAVILNSALSFLPSCHDVNDGCHACYVRAETETPDHTCNKTSGSFRVAQLVCAVRVAS